MNFSEFKTKYQKVSVSEYPNQVPSNPILSIMVQTFQHKDFIGPCLEGLLKQKTDFPFEILLGEDNSTDGTREICKEYADKYPDKIRLFLHHPENKIKVLQVPTGNFNALYNFYSAKGEYIAFCEGDDLWIDSLKLQKQVEALSKFPNHSMCYHSFTEVNENLEPISQDYTLDQPFHQISADELEHLIYHPLLSTICFRNSFQGKIPEEMAEILNVDSFLISLLGNFGPGQYLKSIEPSMYRRHNLGVWGNRKKETKLTFKILTYRKMAGYYSRNENSELSKYYQEKIKSINKMLFSLYLRKGKILKALNFLPHIK